MQLVFAIDDRAHRVTSQWSAGARKRGAHESRVVHAETAKIFFVRKRDVFRAQNLSIGFQMNSFVVDDDAVKVEKDGVDHSLGVLSSFPLPLGCMDQGEGLVARLHPSLVFLSPRRR